jgi:aconitate hydratase
MSPEYGATCGIFPIDKETLKYLRLTGRTEEQIALVEAYVVIAAITSCTNTSNPSVLIGAGLLARKAVEKGLKVQALGEDLAGPGAPGGHRLSRQGRPAARPRQARLQPVGYGCTTCIGNSGPLPRDLKAINDNGPRRAAVLSGNRNFEGRVNPTCGQLPRLAAAGGRLRAGRHASTSISRSSRSARARTASRVYLKDIWPTTKEINAS